MIVMMIPLYGLYFLGVGLSALMMRRHRRLEAEEQAAELARMEAEERAAHEAHAAHAAQQSAHAVVVTDPAQPTQTDEAATNGVIEDASQPVPRSAIVDDLAATDHAPSSDDQLVTNGESTATGEGAPSVDGDTPSDTPSTAEHDPSQSGNTPNGQNPDGKDDNRV
jgi:Flp pilus assembly protein TadG